jgi:hypothetical protein
MLSDRPGLSKQWKDKSMNTHFEVGKITVLDFHSVPDDRMTVIMKLTTGIQLFSTYINILIC